MQINVDDEWESFMAGEDITKPDDLDTFTFLEEINAETGEQQEEFNYCNSTEAERRIMKTKKRNDAYGYKCPVPSKIHISTTSKLAYLNRPIDLNVFWDLPVIPYHCAQNGILQKQMKFNSKTKEELNVVCEKLSELEKKQKYCYYYERIITHIDNPLGKIKFKDIRKVTIGISKKDVVHFQSEQAKKAFYNCFVLIIRIFMEGRFREYHVKVFNTGKIEIPGIQTLEQYETVLSEILVHMKPHISPFVLKHNGLTLEQYNAEREQVMFKEIAKIKELHKSRSPENWNSDEQEAYAKWHEENKDKLANSSHIHHFNGGCGGGGGTRGGGGRKIKATPRDIYVGELVEKAQIPPLTVEQFREFAIEVELPPLDYSVKGVTILINSNFNCHYFIYRDQLFELLKFKYNLPVTYEPCSYPGIKCKMYVTMDEMRQKCGEPAKGDEESTQQLIVSFMIFRTGSILIVGMFNEIMLDYVYRYLRDILVAEFMGVCDVLNENAEPKRKQKKKITYIKIEV